MDLLRHFLMGTDGPPIWVTFKKELGFPISVSPYKLMYLEPVQRRGRSETMSSVQQVAPLLLGSTRPSLRTLSGTPGTDLIDIAPKLAPVFNLSSSIGVQLSQLQLQTLTIQCLERPSNLARRL